MVEHSGHNHSDDTDESDEEIRVDFSKIKNILKSKHLDTVVLILLLLIPIVLTIYVRLQPQYLAQTDSWAQNSVENYYKNSIAQQVNSQYPNLPQSNKDALVNKQFLEFQKTNKDQLNQQIKQTSDYFKTGFQYSENNVTWTFLGDLDSYFYLRQAENIQTKGMVCDEIRNGICWDTYKVAPLGDAAQPTMHPYGIVYLYNIMHIFNPKVTLMHASFILPTILAVIAAIAAFFIGRRLMNTTAGFFAAMFVSLSPMFLTRTLGSDTDIWNIMFPLVIVWIMLEAFHTESLWKKISLSAFTGLVMGIFCFAWGAYWYIFDFIIAALVAYLGLVIIKNYIKHKNLKHVISEDIKNVGIILGVLFISTAIFVTAMNSFGAFTNAFTEPITRQETMKFATNSNGWPNVITTVAEMNAADVGTVISQTSFGINVLFALALLGIILTLIKRDPGLKEYLLIGFSAIAFIYLTSTAATSFGTITYLILLMIPVLIALALFVFDKDTDNKQHKVDIKPALLFMIWFVGMIYASTKGVRFIVLLTPVFGIAIGIALGYLYQYFLRIFKEDIHLQETLSKIIVFLVLCIILIVPLQVGIASGKGFMPSMTKGWWDSLTNIRDNSKPDSIINSWWDFGHWFKYVANRHVSLDGASQNSPVAHWLGKILQTDNENESVAILRMLDCKSNNAFEEVNKKYMDTEKSQNVIHDLILMNKDDGKKYLQNLGYSAEEIDTIISYTYCNPPDDYFITSEDMVGKAGVWAHFGLWDFDKAFIIDNVRNKPMSEAIKIMKDRWNYTDEYATKIYYDVQALQTDQEINNWISPWPNYASGSNMLPCTSVAGNLVQCNINMNIGSNSQQNIVLESTVINLSNPESSQILIGAYDKTNGMKLGENTGSWSQLIIADQEMKKYSSNNATINLGFLLNVNHDGNTTSYSALIADPLLIDSTFTKLFYLDGKYMPHFEKFSDKTDITGSRIIVWKVKW